MQSKFLPKLVFITTLFLLLFLTPKLQAQIIFIDSASSATVPDGSSWSKAYPTLQAGLAIATSGDTICVAKGTYQPSSSSSFTITNGLKIYGGFSDTTTIVTLSQRNFVNNTTILLGNGNTVINTSQVDNTTVLDGFTITGGNNILGGGMSNSSSSPTLDNLIFLSNSALVLGGGMFNLSSSPILTNVTFANNIAYSSGGGMYNSSSSPTLINVVFSANSVASNGGAIYNTSSSSPIITNVTFSNNKATRGNGAGISNNYSSSPIITNAVFWGNTSIVLAGTDIYNDPTSTPNTTYSFTQNAVSGTGNITGHTDPFTNDANNPAGADGIFMTADDGLQLLGCSPAVNNGNNAANVSTNDIAGQPRVFDATIDMGAYEYQSTPEVYGTDLAINNDAVTQLTYSGINELIANGSCRSIAELLPNGTNPVSGSVTTTVWIDPTVESYQSQPYVQRHYDITPDTGAVTATATVTLYFTQAEFDAYNAVAAVKLPTSSTDASGIANLIIKQFHGISATGTPGTYSGGTVTIDPADSNIVWNSSLNRWEITFNINGFSGFIVTTNNPTVLPLSLLSFTGKLSNGKTELQWQTANELNTDHFEVDRSTDNNNNFTFLTNVKADGTGNNTYAAVDAQPQIGNNYYRLKSVDDDGSYSYSNIVLVQVASNSSPFVIYPNPTNKQLTVEYDNANTNAIINIYSLDGKKVLSTSTNGQSKTIIDVSNLITGTYLIQYNGEETFRDKFIKLD